MPRSHGAELPLELPHFGGGLAAGVVATERMPAPPAVLTNKQLVRLLAASLSPGSNRVGLALSLAGVSQATVGRAVGMSQPYVSDVVRGRYRTITIVNARRLARYFGCGIEAPFPTDPE